MREIMRKIKQNNYNLVYEGRAHLLKHTNFDEKQWIFRHRMQKRELPTTAYCIKWRIGTLLNAAQGKKRSQYITRNAAMHPPAWKFPTFKSVKSAMYRSRAKRFPLLPATRQQLEIPAHWRVTKSGRPFFMYNNRKIYGNWLDSLSGAWTEHLKLFLNSTSNCSTIHVFKEAKLIPLVYGFTVRKDVICYCEIFDNGSVRGCPSAANYYLRLQDCPYAAVQVSFPGVQVQGCYFHFCQAVLRKVADLGLRTRYLHEAEIKTIIKMLLATAFLPLDEVPDAVDLLGRDVTGSVAALFEYFREEWMTPNRMPLWNVYHVINRQAGKRHLTFYELLRLLIDEQDSTETLLEQVTSGRVTASHLRAKNSKYEDVQLCISALTAEYDGGTRTMEQFLRAVAYGVPEPLNF
ncbi:hypothetical protein T06_5189 [Trichinella sp. T6]|nr:hypothetical protein T06_5189 [Trichinella sp. T6]